jgi:hypothetical protein
MKKNLLMLIMVLAMVTARTQNTIQASIQPGAASNQVDIVFKPSALYTSAAGEYVNYLSLAIAFPTLSAGNVTPTITMKGPFTGMSMVPAIPFSWTNAGETVFAWVYSSGPSTMSWTGNTPFVGATITFTGGASFEQIKLADFTNYIPSGGTNSNSYYLIVTNVSPYDATPYSDLFYPIPGVNTEATYANGDQYLQTMALISLPVNFASFSGYRNGNTNTLHWSTASENNNFGFEVQRSLDGNNFSRVDFVYSKAPNGNSPGSIDYTFDDKDISGEKQYYRIRQVDLDHKGKLSQIVMITGEKALRLKLSRLFPNPVQAQFNAFVESPVNQRIKMMVTDLTGKILEQRSLQVGTGSNTITVDAGKLAAGNYILKMTSEAGSETDPIKFLKQ